jgi:hypothetical protein
LGDSLGSGVVAHLSKEELEEENKDMEQEIRE